jgi:SAM-dependent methyltransferase
VLPTFRTVKETATLMNVASQANDEQSKHWNGTGGHAWLELQAMVNQVLQPFSDLLVKACSGRVLDVGCGSGGTTIAAARAVGPNGSCTGLDISEPLITAAREYAKQERVPATFILADAQTHEFELACFDRVISRFGVMFFDDPAAAFENLRLAAKTAAELHFVAWRGPADNPFMTTAERAAAPLLPVIPPRRPDAPGPFGLADRDRTRRILKDSGWADIDIQPIDVACVLPEKELVRYFTRLGPLAPPLQQTDDSTRAAIIKTVRAAFEPYVQGAEVRYTAACWIVRARA